MLRELLEPGLPVIVQGATGRTGRRHAEAMRRYGTRIVAGVSLHGRERQLDGIPLFSSCAEAAERTGARATVAFVAPLDVLGAIREALHAGLKLIVSPTEGMPVHDALKALQWVREHHAVWIGPSTPGFAIPGRMKLGFLPDIALAPGSIGVMSKSGTLSYETCYRLKRRGLGQSIWIGVGGDTVKGVRFADLLPLFADDQSTEAVLLIGEIGGTEEEELADVIGSSGFRKPVFALLAGAEAPPGVTMGHAGALIHGSRGTIQSKSTLLTRAGVSVHRNINEIVEEISHVARHRTV